MKTPVFNIPGPFWWPIISLINTGILLYVTPDNPELAIALGTIGGAVVKLLTGMSIGQIREQWQEEVEPDMPMPQAAAAGVEPDRKIVKVTEEPVQRSIARFIFN